MEKTNYLVMPYSRKKFALHFWITFSWLGNEVVFRSNQIIKKKHKRCNEDQHPISNLLILHQYLTSFKIMIFHESWHEPTAPFL